MNCHEASPHRNNDESERPWRRPLFDGAAMTAGKLVLMCVLSMAVLHAHGASVDEALEATVSGKRLSGAGMAVARIDRNAYGVISDQASFDRSSRQAILAFAQELSAYENMLAAKAAHMAEGRQDRVENIRRLIDRFWNELLVNYQNALKSCSDCGAVSTIDDLRNFAGKAQADVALKEFYKVYLAEQFRLGALFHGTSSEIEVFNDNEITGSKFNDMEFLFSFDDGPSNRNGFSDRLIESLDRLDNHAVFFALGERLNIRQKTSGDLAKIYANQCLASHGQMHQSHAKMKAWQASVLDSLAAAKAFAPNAFINAFRPPYGQRRADSGDFFKRHKIKVVLWNMDSQDWQKQISAQNAVDRVIALMLLRRKGIILFHDVHAKSPVAVPQIIQALKRTNIKWLDCRNSPYFE
jgi:peptidoglycan/xylan/chitin deacetylase (PgdA/CDA1 family)